MSSVSSAKNQGKQSGGQGGMEARAKERARRRAELQARYAAQRAAEEDRLRAVSDAEQRRAEEAAAAQRKIAVARRKEAEKQAEARKTAMRLRDQEVQRSPLRLLFNLMPVKAYVLHSSCVCLGGLKNMLSCPVLPRAADAGRDALRPQHPATLRLAPVDTAHGREEGGALEGSGA